MLKRFIAIAAAVLIVVSMAVVAVSAAEVSDSAVGGDSSSAVGGDSSSAVGAGDLIYFDANGWNSFSKVYCHIHEIGGNSFFGFMTPAEACEKVSGTKYSYDLSKLKDSLDISGGMKAGGKYCVNFVNDKQVQTFDLTIGIDCAGDTAYLTGDQLENPVKSEGLCAETAWENHSGKYASHLTLTSVGNIVGSKLAPGETGIQVIGDWVPDYFNSTYCDPVEVLSKAYGKFGIKTISDLTKAYGVTQAKVKKNSKYSASDLPEMKKIMEDAFYKAYPSQKGEKIDEKEAEKVSEKIESGEDVAAVTGAPSGGGSSDSGSTSGGGSYSGDSSGSGADGQETTIFFVLGGVMAVAAGAMFISRKKREE